MAFDTAALDVAAIGQGITLMSGDCRTVLPTLAANSVQCCVTSPPYYALRSYLDASHPDKHRELGSEATPDEFIAQMVAVFRAVRRVLRDDGTCWINLGDSYNANQGSGFNGNAGKATASPRMVTGLAPKQLLMMPARVALALQADGWWLRSAIVWAKPNPMPESVTDRPTSAYEMVYLLAKRSRYYFDADAVRETETSRPQNWTSRVFGKAGGDHRIERPERFQPMGADEVGASGRNCRNVWTIATSPFSAAHFATFPPELAERCIRAGTSERGCCAACGAPWVRQTSVSYTNAGNGNNNMKRKGGGDYVAAMSARPYEVRKLKDVETIGWAPTCTCHGHFEEVPAAADWIRDETGERKTVRVYVPDDNAPPPVPCTILDPFAGAGTALLVADRLQRNAIGIELNTAYTTMAMERCRADAPLLAADRLFSSWPPAEDPADQRMAYEARQRDLFGC